MNRKHLLTFVVIVLVLGALVYLQVREWRRFDWATFRAQTENIQWLQILFGALLISDVSFIGYILLVLFVLLVGGLYAMWRNGPQISAWLCKRLTPFSQSFATSLEHKLTSLSEGLHAVRDFSSFLQATGISFVIWMIVALAYRQVLHAFDPSTGLADYGLPQGILLMGASVAGGVAQLPFIGGGSQLATIAILSRSFDYSSRPEIAVAAGMMFWLVTFISVAPLGLVLARFEHVSLRQLSEESEAEEQDAPADSGKKAR